MIKSHKLSWQTWGKKSQICEKKYDKKSQTSEKMPQASEKKVPKSYKLE